MHCLPEVPFLTCTGLYWSGFLDADDRNPTEVGCSKEGDIVVPVTEKLSGIPVGSKRPQTTPRHWFLYFFHVTRMDPRSSPSQVCILLVEPPPERCFLC